MCSSLSATLHYRAECEGRPISISTLNEVKLPNFHDSGIPYIVNIKTEEDSNIKQEEDI